MTIQEKALAMVEEYAEVIPPKIFGQLVERDYVTAKKYAIVHVNEMIEELKDCDHYNYRQHRTKYWQQIKEEIESL